MLTPIKMHNYYNFQNRNWKRVHLTDMNKSGNSKHYKLIENTGPFRMKL